MGYKILPRPFYLQDTITVAKKLLGKLLVHHTKNGKMVAKITETEAYLSHDDPACHAARGMTKRNQVMFGEPGRAYVYFIYGNYYCLNVVTAKKGTPEAVLIRSVEPLEGVELMKTNRQMDDLAQLTNGPGKLAKAMSINGKYNGTDLTSGDLIIVNQGEEDFQVVTTTRVGVTGGKELPLRFYIKGNKFISQR